MRSCENTKKRISVYVRVRFIMKVFNILLVLVCAGLGTFTTSLKLGDLYKTPLRIVWLQVTPIICLTTTDSTNKTMLMELTREHTCMFRNLVTSSMGKLNGPQNDTNNQHSVSNVIDLHLIVLTKLRRLFHYFIQYSCETNLP